MRLRQLGAAIRQVRHAQLVASRLENVIEAAKLERRQIVPSGLLGRFCTVLATPIMFSTRV